MATLAERIRRHFLWLLLGAYAVAVFVPGPGVSLATLDLGDRATAPLVMVAVLLFLAAMAIDISQLRGLVSRPLLWITALAFVWIGPAAAVGVAGWLLPGLAPEASAGLLLGMTLVAAMPVANSSVAWAQQSGGSLPWSLGLVVLSILLAPWVTPLVLRLAGLAVGGETQYVEQLVRSFSGAPFIVWVLLPTLAGFGLRRWLGEAGAAEIAPARHLLSSLILLVLNYANGSLALPKFFEHPSATVLAAAALAAVALAAVGVLLAGVLAWTFRLDAPTRDAMRFALCMKHTGLAFALATAAGVADVPEAMLLLVVATPTQHLVSALLVAWTANATPAD